MKLENIERVKAVIAKIEEYRKQVSILETFGENYACCPMRVTCAGAREVNIHEEDLQIEATRALHNGFLSAIKKLEEELLTL